MPSWPTEAGQTLEELHAKLLNKPAVLGKVWVFTQQKALHHLICLLHKPYPLCCDRHLITRPGFPVIHFIHPWVLPRNSSRAQPCSQMRCAPPSSSIRTPSPALPGLQHCEWGCRSPLPHAAAGMGLVWGCVRGLGRPCTALHQLCCTLSSAQDSQSSSSLCIRGCCLGTAAASPDLQPDAVW
jgi:hypothetical protein